MLDKKLIKKIKTAQRALGIDDVQYRAILSGFISDAGTPAASCTQLNDKQAAILLSLFEKAGFKSKYSKMNPFAKYDGRDYKFATSRQMLKVFLIWRQNSKDKTEESLIHFAKKIIKRDHISFWLRSDIKKLIRAVEELK